MNKFFRMTAVLCLLIIPVIFVSAQDNRDKVDQFNKIAKLTQSKKPEDLDKALELSKAFLNQYGKDANDEQVKKVSEFYHRQRITTFNKHIDALEIPQAYSLGKEILADEPENTYVFINMAYGGYQTMNKKKDKTFAADSINYAKQALALLEAGKVPASLEPFKNQAEVTALMYYIIGTFSVDSDPHLAAANFYKALQYESQIKSQSYPYYVLAFGYEKDYEKLAKEYQEKGAAKTPEAEMVKLQDKLMIVVDRMLDAYARAIKYGEAEKSPDLNAWKQRFNDVYKYRNQSDAGAADYLNAVAAKPLPDPNAL